jgi:hypothetical protein
MTTRRATCSCGKLEIVCEGEPIRISTATVLSVSVALEPSSAAKPGSAATKLPLSLVTQPNSRADQTLAAG